MLERVEAEHDGREGRQSVRERRQPRRVGADFVPEDDEGVEVAKADVFVGREAAMDEGAVKFARVRAKRGLHLQHPPHGEVKLVRTVSQLVPCNCM